MNIRCYILKDDLEDHFGDREAGNPSTATIENLKQMFQIMAHRNLYSKPEDNSSRYLDLQLASSNIDSISLEVKSSSHPRIYCGDPFHLPTN